MFGKNTLSLGRVYDKVTFNENGEKMVLHVNADPARIVIGLSEAQKHLVTITADTPDDEREKIARLFATVIFGEEQTQKLFDYYFGDPSCVVSACALYFSKRLSKLIAEAQKKRK